MILFYREIQGIPVTFRPYRGLAIKHSPCESKNNICENQDIYNSIYTIESNQSNTNGSNNNGSNTMISKPPNFTVEKNY